MLDRCQTKAQENKPQPSRPRGSVGRQSRSCWHRKSHHVISCLGLWQRIKSFSEGSAAISESSGPRETQHLREQGFFRISLQKCPGSIPGWASNYLFHGSSNYLPFQITCRSLHQQRREGNILLPNPGPVSPF